MVGVELAAIFAGWGNSLIDQAALDQAALFPIVEEERFVTIFVVQFAESDRAANVESISVLAEFRGFCASRVGKVSYLPARASFRRNSQAPAWKSFAPDLICRVMVAEEERPYSAP